MMYDKQIMGTLASRLGFVRDTFEKMYRLADILADIAADPVLSDVLALKGGTAINLTIFNLPRLSLDIDFDFIGITTRKGLETAKADLQNRISGYMNTHGYELKAGASKIAHSLNSSVYGYINAGGNRDNIKIEVNYSLRSHILPTELRHIETLGVFKPMEVRCVAPIEIFAAKTVALLTRTAMRDLYDIGNLIKFGLFDEAQTDTLRKCAVFYAAIAGKGSLDHNDIRKIDAITYNRVKTDLKPVLRKGDRFDLESIKKEVKELLEKLLVLLPDEREFLDAFQNHVYKPELLFDGDTLERIRNHPMALWRTSAGHNDPSAQDKASLLNELNDAKAEADARNAAYKDKQKLKKREDIEI